MNPHRTYYVLAYTSPNTNRLIVVGRKEWPTEGQARDFLLHHSDQGLFVVRIEELPC